MVLHFATDCTGMDATRVALQRILPTSALAYCFASEIEEAPRQVIATQCLAPRVLYKDATAQRPDLCSVDIYVAGPPCQSFSMLSDQKGFGDTRGRVMHSVIDYIKTHLPKIFIIENVKALLSNNKGETWSYILKALRDIPKNTTVRYNLKKLNTSDRNISLCSLFGSLLSRYRRAIWCRSLSDILHGSIRECMSKLLGKLSSLHIGKYINITHGRKYLVPKNADMPGDVDSSLDCHNSW